MKNLRAALGASVFVGVCAGTLWANWATVFAPRVATSAPVTLGNDSVDGAFVNALNASAQLHLASGNDQLGGGAGEDPPISPPLSE